MHMTQRLSLQNLCFVSEKQFVLGCNFEFTTFCQFNIIFEIHVNNIVRMIGIIFFVKNYVKSAASRTRRVATGDGTDSL